MPACLAALSNEDIGAGVDCRASFGIARDLIHRHCTGRPGPVDDAPRLAAEEGDDRHLLRETGLECIPLDVLDHEVDPEGPIRQRADPGNLGDGFIRRSVETAKHTKPTGTADRCHKRGIRKAPSHPGLDDRVVDPEQLRGARRQHAKHHDPVRLSCASADARPGWLATGPNPDSEPRFPRLHDLGLGPQARPETRA